MAFKDNFRDSTDMWLAVAAAVGIWVWFFYVLYRFLHG